MISDCHFLSYSDTKAFSKIVLDYISGDEKLRPFYTHPVSLEGIEAAIKARLGFHTNRELLVHELRSQYTGLGLNELQETYLTQLLSSGTFTITTAHQPNIFTGHLYFIYKILHTIRLARQLKEQLPAYDFVPVYYMGSEDADLEELGHININGEKIAWQTDQAGAVGRMHTAGLEKIIERLRGEFGELSFGEEMVRLCTTAYTQYKTIQEATLFLVNELFRDYGLLVLIPDNAALKRSFEPIVRRELVEQFSHKLVESTIAELGKHYKVQAGGREINLFYLDDKGRRERIELAGDQYQVPALGLVFSREELLSELEQHPERFSANVILRGLFQETILPNIAFIGGGGELAYWLELKRLFEATAVPYPVLVLRNSFLVIERRDQRLMEHLDLSVPQLFEPELDLQKLITTRSAENRLELGAEQLQVNELYSQMQHLAGAVDPTLQPHVAALHARALKDIYGLEKKMLRSEKRKFGDQHRQLAALRSRLFPQNSLQERVDNFMPLYAKYGRDLLDALYAHSLALDPSFAVMELKS